jgi:hypothetical protein
VTVQRLVLQNLAGLRERFGVTVALIAHGHRGRSADASCV